MVVVGGVVRRRVGSITVSRGEEREEGGGGEMMANLLVVADTFLEILLVCC